MGMEDVIVIGAGYAGVLAANRLAHRARVRIVAPQDALVDRIRLHEVAAGTRSPGRVTRPLDQALDRRVARTIGRAVAVAGGRVRLESGDELRARHVLLAHGRSAARPGSIESLEGALDVRRRVAALGDGGSVEVVGAGLTGIEVASEIAATRPGLRVRLISRDPVGSALAPGAAASLRRSLERMGVEVALRAHVQASTRSPGASMRSADVEIDATGPMPEPLGATSELPVDAAGRIRVDDRLRVLDARDRPIDGLWGAGDAVAVEGMPWLRNACASAEPLAASAADRILASLDRKPLAPINIGFAFRCISLGRRDGLIQFVAPDDRPRPMWLSGRAAAAWKEMVSTAAAIAPVRWSRSYRPFGGPRG